MVKSLNELKIAVYGENHEGDRDESKAGKSEASRKRKAIAENAAKECANFDWPELADNGKVSTFLPFLCL